MNINLFVSPNCFVYCKGCYSYSRDEKCCSRVKSSVIINFLTYMYNKGLRKVTICGGDPLTREDIIPLLEQIKNIGYHITLDTMGLSLLSDVYINNNLIAKKTDVKKFIKLVDMIGIPIDGSKLEIVKMFRPSNEDVLRKLLKVCDLLHKNNANICINTVAHKENLKDALNLSRLISEMSYIDKWQIFQFIPSGTIANKYRRMFEITSEEFNKFKQDIIYNFKGNTEKIQFKDRALRDKKYMMIDNSGNVWVPTALEDFKTDNIYERIIVGNVNNEGDWDNLYLFWEKHNN